MHARDVVNLPKWSIELLTSAKSFEHNPLIGSRFLNERGLHAARVRLAHRIAEKRRARIAPRLPLEQRAAFERDGFFVQRDFLPKPVFAALLEQLTAFKGPVREKLEGDTLMRKLLVSASVRHRAPALRSVIDAPDFRAMIAYAGASDAAPAVYIQSLFRSAKPGDLDPQTLLHADTFHPNAKAWLFLTDVAEDEGAFTYVPGSHHLTDMRLLWEARMSRVASASDNRQIREGSFRVTDQELERMGFSSPVRLAVPANTLVVADTFGFHARGPSVRVSRRIEVWAFGRRSPFLPWAVDGALQRAFRRSDGDEWVLRDGVSPFDAPTSHP